MTKRLIATRHNKANPVNGEVELVSGFRNEEEIVILRVKYFPNHIQSTELFGEFSILFAVGSFKLVEQVVLCTIQPTQQ
jgi:hypothetical protein